jgi:hypothetical protein
MRLAFASLCFLGVTSTCFGFLQLPKFTFSSVQRSCVHSRELSSTPVLFKHYRRGACKGSSAVMQATVPIKLSELPLHSYINDKGEAICMIYPCDDANLFVSKVKFPSILLRAMLECMLYTTKNKRFDSSDKAAIVTTVLGDVIMNILGLICTRFMTAIWFSGVTLAGCRANATSLKSRRWIAPAVQFLMRSRKSGLMRLECQRITMVANGRHESWIVDAISASVEPHLICSFYRLDGKALSTYKNMPSCPRWKPRRWRT